MREREKEREPRRVAMMCAICVASSVASMVIFFLNGFAGICGVLAWFELML